MFQLTRFVMFISRTLAPTIGVATNWVTRLFHPANRLLLVTSRATNNRLRSLAKMRTAAFFRRSSIAAIMLFGQLPTSRPVIVGISFFADCELRSTHQGV